MLGHSFISYSSVDALDFAFQLREALQTGTPPFPVWLDRRDIRLGRDWGEEIAEAIKTCGSLLFVMTPDSVEPQSVCTDEWTRAIKYQKPIIPILLHHDTDPPFRLDNRHRLDFTGDFDQALTRLREHLQWLDSPAGVLQTMLDRLADALREARRTADPAQQTRIQDDIAELERQIAEQRRIVADPEAAARRAEESIRRGLERERQPARPIGGVARSKFINPPPGAAPTYFQDRHVETRLIGDFLKDEALRLMTIVGRSGVGKTAMVCRLLKALESGQLPDDLGPLSVDGIVYLSATGSRRVTMPNLYADLGKLLPDDVARQLDTLYKDPQASTEAKMQALLGYFPSGRTVLLLDNFEDVVDPETLGLKDAELDEALRALLSLPQHGVKVILTTRVAPRDLALVQPGRQTRLDLDEGLASPYAENILREMDADGKVGLKSAPPELLDEARERTRGYPRALEALFAILSADRDTSLRDILDDTARLLPENVVEALVGEAYSRLDAAAQRVMQALAVYARPVTPASVDYLLQLYLPSVNSAPALNRLVNMQFVRKEAGRYYLHPVDRAYALGRVPRGDESDRSADPPPYTQFALLHSGAEYFKQARLPHAEWKRIEHLTPQLAEFELRYEGHDYDTAADVLIDIDFHYLLLWGHYRLMVELHERLQGRISDPTLSGISAGNLGTACRNMGQVQRAIACYEQALASARERKSRQGEGAWLGGLGSAYSALGQTARAIDYQEQALAVARGIDDRRGEGNRLGNLGNRYAELGQTTRAVEYYQQALAVAREIGDRQGEGIRLGNLAAVLIDEERYEAAAERARESIRIANDIDKPASFSNAQLALALFSLGDLAAARHAAEAARQYDQPQHNHSILALLGLIALRQGDRAAAQEAFETAVDHADAMLLNSSQSYSALDARGLAFCGLALCVGGHYLPVAVEAYRAARAINRDAGIVGRVLRLFDALAVADSENRIIGVRLAAAGEA